MTEQHDPDDVQMAVDSSGDDAAGTTQDPADHPNPRDEDRPAGYADEAGADAPDEERPVPISDGDAVANPDSVSSAEPDLPSDIGPDAVPPGNAEGNEYTEE